MLPVKLLLLVVGHAFLNERAGALMRPQFVEGKVKRLALAEFDWLKIGEIVVCRHHNNFPSGFTCRQPYDGFESRAPVFGALVEIAQRSSSSHDGHMARLPGKPTYSAL